MSDDGLPLFFGRDGKPITRDQWAARDEASMRVAQDDVVTPGGRLLWISTVWLGLDMRIRRGGAPLIFETMAFEQGIGDDVVCQRYTTEADALAGHAEIVHAALEGLLDTDERKDHP